MENEVLWFGEHSLTSDLCLYPFKKHYDLRTDRYENWLIRTDWYEIKKGKRHKIFYHFIAAEENLY